MRSGTKRIQHTLADWVHDRACRAIELGPLDSPLLSREQFPNLKYADYFSTEQLRRRIQNNPNRDADRVVDLDLVLGGRRWSDLLAARSIDLFVASHVLEHVPDLFGWLADLSTIMAPGGLLFAVIPDKRFTFDVDRPFTSVGELVHNRLERREKPAPSAAFDQVYYRKPVQAKKMWRAPHSRARIPRACTPEDAMRAYETAQRRYRDCHCNVFTPESFDDAIGAGNALGFIDVEITRRRDTEKPFLDFIRMLRFG